MWRWWAALGAICAVLGLLIWWAWGLKAAAVAVPAVLLGNKIAERRHRQNVKRAVEWKRAAQEQRDTKPPANQRPEYEERYKQRVGEWDR